VNGVVDLDVVVVVTVVADRSNNIVLGFFKLTMKKSEFWDFFSGV